MRDVYFYGELGEEFGTHHRLEVSSPVEVIRCFKAYYKRRFMDHIAENDYLILRGKDIDSGFPIPLEEVQMSASESRAFHFIPKLYAQKKGKSIVFAIVGIALISFATFGAGGAAAGAAFTSPGEIGLVASGFNFGATAGFGLSFGQIALFGASLVLQGVSALLAPSPDTSGPVEAPAARRSFLFTGSTNTIEQGGPVPILYGRMRVGSSVVSAGLSIEPIIDPPNPATEDPVGLVIPPPGSPNNDNEDEGE